MVAAIIGAFLGLVSLTTLIDNIAGTDVTAWFFEKVGNAVMFFLEPVTQLFSAIYDGLISLVSNFFST